jgi:hypothetical protein
MGWARVYELQAEVAEMQSYVVELESDLSSVSNDHDALVDEVDFYVFIVRVVNHLLASGLVNEAIYVLRRVDRFAYRAKGKCPQDALLYACRIADDFAKRAALLGKV